MLGHYTGYLCRAVVISEYIITGLASAVGTIHVIIHAGGIPHFLDHYSLKLLQGYLTSTLKLSPHALMVKHLNSFS